MPAEHPTILATSMGFNRARDPWQPSPVFRYAFGLAGNPSRPRLCFISTSTGDKQASIDSFYAAFVARDVATSHLALFGKPNVPNIAAHLHGQDVIWIDRGSVVNLLAVWHAHGVDKILHDCRQEGVVLAGESAGSLCWFSGGTTNSFGKVQPFTDGLKFLPSLTRSTTAIGGSNSADTLQMARCRMGMLPTQSRACTLPAPTLWPRSATGRTPGLTK